jgi:RNA polymerase subunit RPABC4/transcription elongation factor Spt4
MNFEPSALSDFVLILAAWGGAFLAALWLSLIIWTYRDIRARAKDPLARILAVLVVGVLFLPGIVIYLILRPSQSLEEEYQYMLEEEALLQSIEERPSCPGCARHVEEDWMLCPNCHTKLKKTCRNCHRLMMLPWSLCPYCGTPEKGKFREDMSVDDVLQSLQVEEQEEAPDPLDLDDYLEGEEDQGAEEI